MSSIYNQLKKTKAAAAGLTGISDKKIQLALKAMAAALPSHTPQLLAANAKDMARQSPDNPKNDRLLLTAERIKNIANSIKNIAGLDNPGGKLLLSKKLDNGLELEKITVPLGVVGAIYESRPNVTFDIAALCLRSHNGCVLKGSTDAAFTNKVAVKFMQTVLKEAGIAPSVICLLPPEREVVDALMQATDYVDVLIPRGSDSLIRYVRTKSLVPVIETGAGVCHVYVEARADLKKALDIVYNAKVSRPSVCNAADTILIEEAIAEPFLKLLGPKFEKAGVEIFADPGVYAILKGYPKMKKARKADFALEHLRLACGIKLVNGLDEALAHIAKYSTKHSESIVSEHRPTCEKFIQQVDAAAVYSNASTRFTDGEVFGLGAEIGISTQKLHARGPFALEKLVTEKWILRGKGQIR